MQARSPFSSVPPPRARVVRENFPSDYPVVDAPATTWFAVSDGGLFEAGAVTMNESPNGRDPCYGVSAGVDLRVAPPPYAATRQGAVARRKKNSQTRRSEMRRAFLPLILTAMVSLLVGPAAVLAAEHGSAAHSEQGEMPGHSHERCELHGGEVAMTKAHHFETVFAPDGIHVYMYSEKQDPLPIDGPAGIVTLKEKAGATRDIKMIPDTTKAGVTDVYFCEMYDSPPQHAPGKCPTCGMTLVLQKGLFAPADLSKTPPNTLKATVHLTRLGGDENEVTFTETYAGPQKEKAATPAKSSGAKMHGHDKH